MKGFNNISTAILSFAFFTMCGEALAERPAFQAPFSCGQKWQAWTYDIPDNPTTTTKDEEKRHGPFAIDSVQRDGDGSVIGDRQPIRASAAGKIAFDYTWPDTDKEGERWIFVDHDDGWRTHYVHLADEPDRAPLKPGRKIAMGEILGFTSNSGTSGIHLHYSQRKNISHDAAKLQQLAADGKWGSVLRDGEEVRIRFNGKKIETYLANLDVVNTGSGSVPEDIWSINCPAGRFVQWFDNGRNMMLRYNPANGDMRINEIHPTGSDNPLRHSAKWDKTWNTLVPFYSATNGQAHVIRYNFATGDTDFFRVSIGGTGLTPTGSVRKYSGWTDIVPLTLGGKPHAVFYDSRYGWLNVDQVNVTGSGFVSRLKTKVKSGYTHLVPYEEGPGRYVLMYKAGSGRMAIQKLTRASDGSVQRKAVWSKKLRADWTHLSLLMHQGASYVLGYDSVTGDARIWKIKSNGAGLKGVARLDWQPGWTSITPYRDDGRAYALLYRASDGLSRKIRLKADATGFKHQISENWATGYR